MYASALSRESRSSELCWNKPKTENLKNIPDIVDRNVKKNKQI